MRYLHLGLMLSVLLGLTLNAVSAKEVIDDAKAPVYLFTLAAKSGTFEGDKLSLKDVPMAVYFTDRPYRKSGHMSLEKFIGLWDEGIDSFKQVPPTAQLSVYNENGDKHDVLIISRPAVTGDTISFKVKELEESERIPKSFTHATLFIDQLGMIYPSNQN